MDKSVFATLLLTGSVPLLAALSPEGGDKQWIARSNQFTQMLVDINSRHSPESASSQGLKEYDEKIGQPTKADEDKEIAEILAVLAKLQAQLPQEKDKNVAEDLQIVIRRIELEFREHDFSENHEVPFINANSYIFSGIHRLLDDQVAADRRPAAAVRLRKSRRCRPATKVCRFRTLLPAFDHSSTSARGRADG